MEKNYFIGSSGVYNKVEKKLRELPINNKNIFLFDTLNAVCPEDICLYTKDNISLYRDSIHYSNYAAREIIAPKLIEFIKNID